MLRLFKKAIIGSYAIFKIDWVMCLGFFCGLDKRVHLMINCLPFFSFGMDIGKCLIELVISTVFNVTFLLWKKSVQFFFRTEAMLFGLHHTISNLCSLKLYEFVSFFLRQSTTDYFSLYLCMKKLIRINQKKL